MRFLTDILSHALEQIRLITRYERHWKKFCDFLQCFWESDLGIQLSFLINKYFTPKVCFFMMIIFIFLLRYYVCKNASKIFRLPRFLFDWQKKGHYKYHVFINVYLYGGATMERKYDREAFTIEEQVFQQCVPVRALINMLNVNTYNG